MNIYAMTVYVIIADIVHGKKGGEYNMTNREKEVIESIVTTVKDLQQYRTKEEIVRYLDYNIIMNKKLGRSNEFMEKLYFIRYYYNIGKKFI